MKASRQQGFIFKIGAKIKQAFTAAVTNIITSASHGLVTGDVVHLTTTTTLPAGLELLTNYYVIVLTANTFKLSLTYNGPEVDITDTGTGTHTYNLKGHPFLAADFDDLMLEIATSGNANMTFKVQGSQQEDVDFNAVQSPTNRWGYIDIRCLNSSNPVTAVQGEVAGSDGVVLSGTDLNGKFNIESEGEYWINIIVTSYTAGNLQAVIVGTSC